MHQLELVREFMATMGQATPTEQTMLNKKERRFRWSLTREENRELRDAEDLVDYLDAVTDKLYVTFGDAVAAGFDVGTLSQAFHECHRSNMSKRWNQAEVDQVAEILAAYDAKNGNTDYAANHTVTPCGDGLYIVKSSAGKVIKPPSYSPANFAQFITKES